MGPVFQRTTVMVANGTAQPLQTVPAWQHRFLQVDSLIEYAIVASTAGVELEVFLGSSAEVQRGPVSGGGTAGVFQSFQDNKKAIIGAAGDEVQFTLFEVLAGTPSVMLEIHLTPMG